MPMNKPKLEPLDKLFHALSDGTRRSILRRVSHRAHTVKDLTQGSLLGFATVSKHVGVLEDAGLVTKTRQGSFQMISLNSAHLRHAQQWLSFFEAYWDERLDALEAHINEDNSDGSHEDER